MKEGTFSDSVVYNMGNGHLQSRPSITLPRAQLRVVVAMHVPRVNHYTLLEELANLSPHVHVVIHCARWDDTFATTYRDARWTVVVESSEEQYFRGTENVKYLTHLALFWDQLAPLNAFIVDDAKDAAPGHEPHMIHPEFRSLSRTLRHMMTASTPPNFMYVLDRDRFHQNISRDPNDQRPLGFPGKPVNASDEMDRRCRFDNFSRPRHDDDTFYYWLENTLLHERRGYIPRAVSPQSCASFVVSAARLREVVPAGDAFGRILEKSQRTNCADFGARFEVTWPFLFSTCDAESFFESECVIDRGSCRMVGGNNHFLDNASEYIRCD
jgi:hypothetical protein